MLNNKFKKSYKKNNNNINKKRRNIYLVIAIELFADNRIENVQLHQFNTTEEKHTHRTQSMNGMVKSVLD